MAAQTRIRAVQLSMQGELIGVSILLYRQSQDRRDRKHVLSCKMRLQMHFCCFGPTAQSAKQ